MCAGIRLAREGRERTLGFRVLHGLSHDRGFVFQKCPKLSVGFQVPDRAEQCLAETGRRHDIRAQLHTSSLAWGPGKPAGIV